MPAGRRFAEESTGDCNSGLQSMLLRSLANDAVLSLPSPVSDDSDTEPVSQPPTGSVPSGRRNAEESPPMSDGSK